MKYFARKNCSPTVVGLDQDSFRKALEVSAERSRIRKQEASSAEQIIKEASPGKLQDGKKWDIWYPALENMLSLLIGVMVVPLLYFIRSLENPIEGDEFETFVQESIERSPFSGAAFEADARQVHQFVQSLVQGEDAE